jgi:hypothetical protein
MAHILDTKKLGDGEFIGLLAIHGVDFDLYFNDL